MRKALRKGIPPLFVDLVPLYENKSKASIIGNLCQGKKMNTVKLDSLVELFPSNCFELKLNYCS